MLQRLEERGRCRDKIDNFEVQHSDRRWEAKSLYPTVDIELSKRAPGFANSIQWPGGARFAACLTHDVDGIQHNGRRELWRVIGLQVKEAQSLPKKLHQLTSVVGLRHAPSMRDLFSPWLEAESARGFRSTFFVFSSRVRNRHVRDLTYLWEDPMPFEGKIHPVRECFREIASRGWEIGMHGSVLSAFDRGMLKEQREDISNAMGREITAGRQHNLQFETSSTPDHLAAAGFKVDSTLGSNRDIFFRTGSSYPTPLWSLQEKVWLPVMEVPLILHDGALMRSDNLDLAPEAALRASKLIIDRVASVRGVVTLLWHPENIVKPGYFDTYVSLLDYIKEKNGWGAGATEVVNWWKSSGNADRHADALSRLEN
jgi:peptidoglycan/xylan/chitin deacetylase (PgdA/CDA1 family)